MAEQQPETPDQQTQENTAQENPEPLPSGGSLMAQMKGKKQLSLAEYKLLQTRKARKPGFKIPAPAKLILATPFIIIFCCGLVFIPYIIYLTFAGPRADPNASKTDISFHQIIHGKEGDETGLSEKK